MASMMRGIHNPNWALSTNYVKGKCRCKRCRAWSSAYCKALDEANPGRNAANRKAWNAANPDYFRMHYKANRTYRAVQKKAWREANAERWTDYCARRRARKKGAPINDFDEPREWNELLTEHAGCCHYCGTAGKLERDHVIPLSRGGNHTKSNIVPACRSCNASKGDGTAQAFIRRNAA